MKNKFILALVSLFVLASCGGGGGSAPLVISVMPFSSLSVNEDDTYETILTATANQPANISFSITSQPSNAYVSITNSGELTYNHYQIILDQIILLLPFLQLENQIPHLF